MSSKAKQKGSSYEREIAKYLSDTYSEQFLRNLSGSGAWVGGKNAIRRAQLDEATLRHTRGDIIVPESFGRLNCECKNYANFPFHLTLSTQCKQLDTWLQQLLDTGDDSTVNILFIKITRVGQYVAVESKHNWALDNHTVYNSAHLGHWVLCERDTFFRLNRDQFKIISSTETISKLQSTK
jgi:hypothetical protein